MGYCSLELPLIIHLKYYVYCQRSEASHYRRDGIGFRDHTARGRRPDQVGPADWDSHPGNVRPGSVGPSGGGGGTGPVRRPDQVGPADWDSHPGNVRPGSVGPSGEVWGLARPREAPRSGGAG